MRSTFGAFRRPSKIDPRDFTAAQSTRPRGRTGKPQKLSADQAALVFEAQVQIAAHQKLIDRTLAVAGVAPKSRSHALTMNWRARGRIDIPQKLLTAALCEHLTPRGTAKRAQVVGGRS